MEHKLIQGGEQWLAFARSRIKALRATGQRYASQRFAMPDGATVAVQIVAGVEYIKIEGGDGTIAFLGGIAYPMTLESKTKILGGKLTLRTGRAPNYGVQPSGVSPFSNKHIAFKSKNAAPGVFEAVINGAVVATFALPNPLTSLASYASSASDRAAIVISAGKSADTFDRDLSACVCEFDLDSLGERQIGDDEEYLLKHKTVPFPSLPRHYGDSLCAVFGSDGFLYVVAGVSAAASTEFDTYTYSFAVYDGSVDRTTHGFLQLLGTGFPPTIESMFVADSRLYLLCRTSETIPKSSPGTLLTFKCLIYDIDLGVDPIALTLVKTVVLEEIGPTDPEWSDQANRYADMVVAGGIVWTARRCINTHTGVMTVIPNPTCLAPNYMRVSRNGKLAWFYWAYLSPENLVHNGVITSSDPPTLTDQNYARFPLDWLPIPGPVEFIDGSMSAFSLGRDESDAVVVTDVTPAAESARRIFPTKWVYGNQALNFGAALQFGKPAGVK